jgi:hypothetical protein
MRMKMFLAAASLALLTGSALAQSPSSSQNSQANQNSQTNTQPSQQRLAAAQKIKQDLQREGFTDVKIVAESFVVQGKSPDGNPVVMTIGPHGMSVFEAMNVNGSSSGTVGSSKNSSGTSSSNSSGNSTKGTQK